MDYSSKTPIRLLLLILILPTLLWGYGKAIVRFAQITNSADERGDKSGNSGRVQTPDESLEAISKSQDGMEATTTRGEATANVQSENTGKILTNVADSREKESTVTFDEGDAGSTVSQSAGDQHRMQAKESVADASPSANRAKLNHAGPHGSAPLVPDSTRPNLSGAGEMKTVTVAPELGKRSETGDFSKDVIELSNGRNEPVGDSNTYTNRVLKPIIPAASPRTTNDNNLSMQPSDKGPQLSVVGVLGIPTVLFAGLFIVMWGIISGRIQRIMF